MKRQHVIFFDGDCPLCNRAVRFVLREDKKEIFLFAPLNGLTSQKELKGFNQKYPDLDTLILLQDYGTKHQQILIEGRAVFRICWLLGRMYKLLGWLGFLPSALFDMLYRQVACRRFQLFKSKAPLPKEGVEKRFLP